jgi:hypothetical protein
MLEVTLNVQEAYSGVSSKKVVVSTNRSEAACGFPFKIGEQYVVYGHRDLGRVHIQHYPLVRIDGLGLWRS